MTLGARPAWSAAGHAAIAEHMLVLEASRLLPGVIALAAYEHRNRPLPGRARHGVAAAELQRSSDQDFRNLYPDGVVENVSAIQRFKPHVVVSLTHVVLLSGRQTSPNL